MLYSPSQTFRFAEDDDLAVAVIAGSTTQRAVGTWQGSLEEGRGSFLLGRSKHAKPIPFSNKSRFGPQPGVNPERLLAAAFAGCASMNTAYHLGLQGVASADIESIETQATIAMRNFKIESIELKVDAHVPNAPRHIARNALEQGVECPIRAALHPDVSVKTDLNLVFA